jgi:catechol 2,3-dioxygenase-like lactoylglutathione lyase family enzyme
MSLTALPGAKAAGVYKLALYATLRQSALSRSFSPFNSIAEGPVANLTRIIETAIYTGDMERAKSFYEAVMGLKPMHEDQRLTAYDVAGRSVLLVFKRGASTQPAIMAGGTIPGHDGSGPLHLAFAIETDQLEDWEKRLERHGIEIEGRTIWPRGGKSIYFRDPDGHLLELATPGLWQIY